MNPESAAPSASPSPLLRPGHNCWRIETAERVAFLIDGSAYFPAVREAIARARHSVFVLGWDIDSRLQLVPDGAGDGLPEPLGEFLDAAVRRTPSLRVWVLTWDFAAIYAMERQLLPQLSLDWLTHPRLRFRLDACHPFGASHHQKVVVVDDRIAFVGGLDLTRCRWDTPEHRPDEPRRVDAAGTPYAPFHDIEMLVEGPVATALGALARERWLRATGQRLPQPQPAAGDDPWPAGVEAQLRDVPVAIARTEPAFDDYPAVDEIRRFHLDAIAAARRTLFFENQYFTAWEIGAALAARLQDDDAPEVLLITPQRESGWLEVNTMGVLRGRLHRQLTEADHHDRYRACCPRVPGLASGCLNVHSKLMVIDEQWLTIGSANLSNRSMGFDTECNLILEAGGRADVQAAIAGLRARLLGEHLGCAPEAIEAARAAHDGRLLATVDALQQTDDAHRHLQPLATVGSADLDHLIVDNTLIDPERPMTGDQLLAEFTPPPTRRSVRERLMAPVLLALALVGLTLAWRYTPLSEWLAPNQLIRVARELEDLPFTPLAVLAAYTIASVVAIPISLVIGVTGLVFGPLTGSLYAVGGSLAGALAGYGVGSLLGRRTVRRLGGRRFNRLDRKLAERGIFAVVFLRLVPVAPFTIINFAAGASRIGLRDYLLGTLLGLGPGAVLTVVFADRIAAAISKPTPLAIGLMIGCALILLGSGWWLSRYLQRRKQPSEPAVPCAAAPAAAEPEPGA